MLLAQPHIASLRSNRRSCVSVVCSNDHNAVTARRQAAAAVLQHVAAAPLPAGRKEHSGVLGSAGHAAFPPSTSSQANVLSGHMHMLASPVAPCAWHELACSVRASGAAGLHSHLSRQRLELPDVEGAAACRCQLARSPLVHTFTDPALAAFVAALFEALADGRRHTQLLHKVHASAAAQPSTGTAAAAQAAAMAVAVAAAVAAVAAPAAAAAEAAATASAAQQIPGTAASSAAALPLVSLSRWDLHHAHLFVTRPSSSSTECELGVLFHSAEYPAQCEAFPYNLGYCQVGSDLQYNATAMDLRNMLWFKDRLCVLDVGDHSWLNNNLLHDGTRQLRTIYESDFGIAVADVLYFPSLLATGQVAVLSDAVFVSM